MDFRGKIFKVHKDTHEGDKNAQMHPIPSFPNLGAGTNVTSKEGEEILRDDGCKETGFWKPNKKVGKQAASKVRITVHAECAWVNALKRKNNSSITPEGSNTGLPPKIKVVFQIEGNFECHDVQRPWVCQFATPTPGEAPGVHWTSFGGHSFVTEKGDRVRKRWQKTHKKRDRYLCMFSVASGYKLL